MAKNIPTQRRLVLAGALTLQSADGIHSQLLEFAEQPMIEIDCCGATDVDLSLIQLILAARTSARQSGRTVTLAQPAAGALREALQRGGFLSDGEHRHRSDEAFWLQTAGA